MLLLECTNTFQAKPTGNYTPPEMKIFSFKLINSFLLLVYTPSNTPNTNPTFELAY